ncbi:MAG: prepilin peptidase [Puniceicoccales bacterium]|jgi:leader peptidase (prepilin peptidase)/N-methyltransferase|nr:prepilin peptidase [Puniceicoccales bacterium]
MRDLSLAFIGIYLISWHNQHVLVRVLQGQRLPFLPWSGMVPSLRPARRWLWGQIAVMLLFWHFFPNLSILAIAVLLVELLAAARADRAKGIVPDGIVLASILLGIAFASLGAPGLATIYILLPSTAWTQVLAGAMALFLASASLLWLALLFEAVTGREGLGLGDVKLAGVIGLFLGWDGAMRSLFYAAILALLLALLRSTAGRRSLPFGRPQPFAPAMAMGTLLHCILLPHFIF